MSAMRWIGGVFAATILLASGVGAGYWYAQSGRSRTMPPIAASTTATPPSRAIAYYQDPTGKPDFSPAPKKDADGRDYLPVYEDAGETAAAQTPQPTAAIGDRKVLYYRNPMGLTDMSPTPKKDSMGMAYLPVYAGAADDDAGTVTISPGKIQTLGVRTEIVATRIVARTVRAVGTVQFDERHLAVVNPKFEGWIEKLNVNTTGQAVRRGEPMLEVYSPDLVAAEQEYLIARDAMMHMEHADASARAGAVSLRDAALTRLRNWDIPAGEVDQLARTGKVMRTLTLRAPADGVVTDKIAVAGMRFAPGDTLFRIADLSRMWLIADIFEQDLASVRIGAPARITVAAYPAQIFTGTVTFIYPTVSRETRTARVRIELPNPDALLKADMYGQVEIGTAVDAAPVVAVPDSAVIDGGTTQTVLIELGEGRYQPRKVKLGTHGDGYVEVLEGVTQGEKVVVGANFLIDAESNLRAALQSFTQGIGTRSKASTP
jgi:Cu(I)/Ag(I) efflux system membrane fusion protein